MDQIIPIPKIIPDDWSIRSNINFFKDKNHNKIKLVIITESIFKTSQMFYFYKEK